MKRNILIFILLISSCGPILINENIYRNLKVSDKKNIRLYKDIELIDTSKIQEYIYEINSNDIKKELKNHKYTWIHLWRPFCASDLCLNIGYLSNLENEFKKQNLALLIISETYDINIIKMKVAKNNFSKKIYVLQDSYYGHKIKKNRKKFVKEINNSKLLISKYGADNFIFRDTTLIYCNDKIDTQIIDSIVSACP